MIKVIRTALGLTFVGIVVMILMSASAVVQHPVVKRLPAFKGDHFPGFAEFRVQGIEYGKQGLTALVGEPYEMLVNVNYVTGLYRFEDAKKTDHSTIMFTNYSDNPIFIRQNFKDVKASIRKAAEAQVK
jgi:hypothetical protein